MTLDFVIPEFNINGAGTPPIQFYKQGLKIGGSGTTPTYQDIVLSGNGSLSLTNAKANGLNYLKLFGKCEQRNLPAGHTATQGTFEAGPTAVPTPDTPMDIVSNNGVLKFGKPITIDNTRNYAYINTTGSWAWSSDSYSIALPVTVGKKYRIIISSTDSSIVGTIFRYGFTDSDPEEFKQSEVTPSPTSISIYDFWRGTPQDLSDVEVTATHPYMIIQFAAAYASTVVSTYLTVIDQSIYTDGTQEVVTDSLGNTASAERLLAVGDYKDTQEVLSGSVTRNVGIKVLDGTEDWKASTTYNGSTYISAPNGYINNVPLLCTHFVSATQPTVDFARGKCLINGGSLSLWYGDNKTTAVADIKQYLAQQYAQGTPVIVVYPTNSATTETVAHQHLSIQAGTNTIGITQASIDNLELEVSYKGTV